MEKRTFNKLVKVGRTDQFMPVVKYIVTPQEWKGVRFMCRTLKNSSSERGQAVARSIYDFHIPYTKLDSRDPNMPKDSVTFTLSETDAEYFDKVCISTCLLTCRREEEKEEQSEKQTNKLFN